MFIYLYILVYPEKTVTCFLFLPYVTKINYFCWYKVHIKDNNYSVKDLVLKIILHHNYNDDSTEEQHLWNHFRKTFDHLIKIRNHIDLKSLSI